VGRNRCEPCCCVASDVGRRVTAKTKTFSFQNEAGVSIVFAMNLALSSLAFIQGLAGPEGILILMIVMLLFGGKKMPEMARGLGKSVREFKKAAAEIEEEVKRAVDTDDHKAPAAVPASLTAPSDHPATPPTQVVAPNHPPAPPKE
jgi:TatA/E family protein of Tat protein translocase